MGPKKIKTKIEDKSTAYKYLKKAEDNYLSMILALESKNYNAVGTLAIQCAISSTDAICVYKKGERSISGDHTDACSLMSSIPLPESKEKNATLRRIIAKKNAIQYESRNMHQLETSEIAKAAKRVFEWVTANIKNK